jgi:linoleoyl-CoA desaturase
VLIAGYAFAAAPVLALTAGAGHDACHGAVSRHRAVNDLVLAAVSLLNGADPRLVRLRHLQHHQAPAVTGADAEFEQVRIVRLADHMPLRAWHRWQHWYAWPLYALALPFVAYVLDPAQCLRGEVTGYGRIDRRWRHVAGMAAVKLAHFGLWVAGPLALGAPPPAVLAGYAFFACAVSFAFTAILIGTHLVDGARLAPLEGAAGRMACLDRQIRSSVSIAPGSRTARWFFGGIHTHVAHHLFPGVSHGRIDALRRAVEAAAARHGIALIETGMAGALAGHARYLRSRGRPPANGRGGVADGARVPRPEAVIAAARARCAASVRELSAATEALRARGRTGESAPHPHYFFALLLRVSLERLEAYAGRSRDPWLIYGVIDGAYRAHRANVLDRLAGSGGAALSPAWAPYVRCLDRRRGRVTLLHLRRLLQLGIRAHHESDLAEALRQAVAALPEGRSGDVRGAFLDAAIVPALEAAVGDYFAAVHRLLPLPVPAPFGIPLLRAAHALGYVPSIAGIQRMRRAAFDAACAGRFQ